MFSFNEIFSCWSDLCDCLIDEFFELILWNKEHCCSCVNNKYSTVNCSNWINITSSPIDLAFTSFLLILENTNSSKIFCKISVLLKDIKLSISMLEINFQFNFPTRWRNVKWPLLIFNIFLFYLQLCAKWRSQLDCGYFEPIWIFDD